jgi:membrane-bound acyltransferase YfiQ involved in biofilm formation
MNASMIILTLVVLLVLVLIVYSTSKNVNKRGAEMDTKVITLILGGGAAFIMIGALIMLTTGRGVANNNSVKSALRFANRM